MESKQEKLEKHMYEHWKSFSLALLGTGIAALLGSNTIMGIGKKIFAAIGVLLMIGYLISIYNYIKYYQILKNRYSK